MNVSIVEHESIADHVKLARAAQSAWARTPLAERLTVIGRMRRALSVDARNVAEQLTSALPQRRSTAETLAAEVLPLLDGWRFLEKRARAVLRPRQLGARGRPIWLWGSRSTIYREPKGVVLIICPFNYPLLLGGAPMGQALTAGNAVLLKPGRLGQPAAAMLAKLALDAGLPTGLVQVLDDSIEAGLNAIDVGVDHVVMTGSSQAGRDVMRRCTEQLTPVTLELSGCDSVFVQADADLDHVTRCLTFGLSINSSATCIAPRRAWVHEACHDALCQRLAKAFKDGPALHAQPTAVDRLRVLVEQARQDGAELIAGEAMGDGRVRPFVLKNVSPADELLRTDLFAPVLSLVSVASDEQALSLDQACDYALGASVFGKPKSAAALAQQVQAGVVTVNDLIAPTADPRLPFGGRGESGFGVTRGAAGLLELTQIRCVVDRPARLQAHLMPQRDNDADRIETLIQASHGPWRRRIQAWRKLIRMGQ
ncbi:aldehyde dehydrogenase family protein [Phycisphaerales bacterium AB-hyl4]|uniref:Aldehyde dehydrogenase family protein n=1 Tax=Natronomicrosphaera hydrolytica TaxID=3242702 RepID=A0ABV4U158_9BACT